MAYVWVLVLTATAATAGLAIIRAGQYSQGLATCLLLTPAIAGALIVVQQPRHPVGWLFLPGGTAAILSLCIIDDRFAWQPAGQHSSWIPVAAGVLWPLSFPILCLALMWFPDGLLPSRGWRVVAGGQVCVVALAVVTGVVGPVSLARMSGLAMPVLAFSAVLSVPIRYRRSGPDARRRIRWVAGSAVLAAFVIVVVTALGLIATVPLWLEGLAPLPVIIIIPLVVAAAILSERDFDSDLFAARMIRAVLVSVVLVGTALCAGWVVSTLGGTPALSALAAGLAVAAEYRTVVGRSDRLVERRLFGDRVDPLAVLSHARQHVDDVSALQRISDGLAQSLRLPYVAIDVADAASADGWLSAARTGDADERPLTVMPFPHRPSGPAGRIVISARSRREPFTDGELRLMATIADIASSTLETEQLSRTARAAREALARATETERRRLRRELHDGLGSQLTSLGYQIAVLGQEDPHLAAGEEGKRASAQRSLEECVVELRRVIDALRPSPLDDMGLSDALVLMVDNVLDPVGIVSIVSIEEFFADRAALDAATENALYRIATEAVANVARHSRAQTCEVRLSGRCGEVVLQVADNGEGVPARGATGIGLSSMRERAEEIGGQLSITEAPSGGTVVIATLPMMLGGRRSG